MSIELNSPFDMHLHLRDSKMMELVAPLSTEIFSGAVIMPNLLPPIVNNSMLENYRNKILQTSNSNDFMPLMTVFFKNQSESELKTLKDNPHFFAIKLYPNGATTNSDGGVSNFQAAEKTFSAMEDLGIPLLVHGETNGFVLDRESEFLPIYRTLAKKFPRLKISMEHITTAEAINVLNDYENIVATVTLQHLLITLDDVAGGLFKPHLFCKPIAKREKDRDALLNAALSGNSKIMFGSDSAPHPIHKKEACACSAGVFTAPIALQVLTNLFIQHNAIENLQKFISNNAQEIYHLKPIKKTIILEKKDFVIPTSYKNDIHTVIPMFAGETIPWSISKIIK